MEKTVKLSADSKIGHYRIVSKIGEGGMGEVYLAEDAKLFRKVALKILSEDLAEREDRLRRFEQEARAASALNHPNILTIYEIGEFDGMHFLATEYIEGRTLRDMLNAEKLSLDAVLDIAIQIASALSAAHEAGIVHRDIKPENIMVRRDRLLKVLDFGLAKLIPVRDAELNAREAENETLIKSSDWTNSSAHHANLTAPGIIMGTVNYMSPEQARAKETDARTDTWSLGCVIYEMIAGHAPFTGETTADCLAAIIHKEPVPLTRINPDIPVRLDEIVAKCLEKDRDERYQVIKDLLIDMRRLRKKLDLDDAIDRSHAPNDLNRTDAPSENRTQVISPAVSNTGHIEPTRSSAEYVVSGVRRHKTGVTAACLAAVLIVAAGIAGWYKFRATPTKPKGDIQMMRLVTSLNGIPGKCNDFAGWEIRRVFAHA